MICAVSSSRLSLAAADIPAATPPTIRYFAISSSMLIWMGECDQDQDVLLFLACFKNIL
jgi:hypothetical protein